MFLLIDECCGKALVRVAESLGHTAQRTLTVADLGRGASDAEIIEFANRHGAIIVTNNSSDFLALAVGREHPGMLLLPNAIGRDLARLFQRALTLADAVFANERSMFVAVDADGSVRSFRLS